MGEEREATECMGCRGAGEGNCAKRRPTSKPVSAQRRSRDWFARLTASPSPLPPPLSFSLSFTPPSHNPFCTYQTETVSAPGERKNLSLSKKGENVAQTFLAAFNGLLCRLASRLADRLGHAFPPASHQNLAPPPAAGSGRRDIISGQLSTHHGRRHRPDRHNQQKGATLQTDTHVYFYAHVHCPL